MLQCEAVAVRPPEHYFFRIWLPQIIGYAEMIADETVLRKAWVKGDRSRTSVYYPGELFDQIRSLTPQEIRGAIRDHLAEDSTLAQALEEFIHRVELLWFWAEATLDTKTWGSGCLIAHAEQLFTSDQWQKLRELATTVTTLASLAGFRSEDWIAELR